MKVKKFRNLTNNVIFLDDNHESVEDTAELISSLFFQIDVESVGATKLIGNHEDIVLLALQKSNENSKPFGAANQLIRNANLHHRLVHAHNVSFSIFKLK